MGMVTWSFLDLHPSYSGWTNPARGVSGERGGDAREGLDVSGPAATGDALAPRVTPKPDPDSTPDAFGRVVRTVL